MTGSPTPKLPRSTRNPAAQTWLRRGDGAGILSQVAASSVIAVCAGCAVLTSETPQQILNAGRDPVGVHYSLPRRVLDLKLLFKKDSGEFILAVTPRTIADPVHHYVLRYKPRANYDDNVTMSVNSQGFLRFVKAVTTDQTPTVIVNLFKLPGQLGAILEAGEAAGPLQIANDTVDPTDERDLARVLVNLNKALVAYTRKKQCEAEESYAAKATCLDHNQLKMNGEAWLELAKMGVHMLPEHRRKAPIQVWIRRAAEAEPHVHRAARRHGGKENRIAKDPNPADCTVGICYRPPLPYLVRYSVGSKMANHQGVRIGGIDQVELMPNEARLIEIDISRIFFAKKMTEIQFNEVTGYLDYVKIEKDSELEAVSKLPLDIITAMLDVLKFRLNVLTYENDEAKAQKELIEQRRELARQKLLLESALVEAQAQQSRAVSVLPLSRSAPVGQPMSSTAGPDVVLPGNR